MKFINVIVFFLLINTSYSSAQRDFVDIIDLITPDLVIKNGIKKAIIIEDDLKDQYTFDNYGNIIENELYEEDKLTEKSTYFYEEDKPIKMIRFDEEGKEIQQFIWKYNNNQLQSVYQNRQGEVTTQSYFYDSNNQLSKSVLKQTFSDGLKHETVYSYDSIGRIDTIFSINNNEITVDKHFANYTITTITNETGRIIGRKTIHYNELNQPISSDSFSIIDIDEVKKSYEKTQFLYNERNLLQKIIYLSKDNHKVSVHYKLVD